MRPIDTLRQLLPPPSDVVGASPREIAAAEAALGVSFPDDYKELVSVWGAFGIDHFLHIMVPAPAPYPQLDIVHMASENVEFVDLSPIVPESGMAAHPAPGGLLGWARSDGGALLAWQTVGAPNDWPVVALGRDGLDLDVFQGGAAAMLVAMLEGRRFCGFPEDFPDTPSRLTANWRSGRNVVIDRIAEAVVTALDPCTCAARARERWEEIEISENATEYPDDIRAAFASGKPSGRACFEVLLAGERAGLSRVVNGYLEQRLLDLTGSRVVVTGEAEESAMCPCCRYLSLPEDSFMHICSVCFWQNDGGGAGANALSLEESRKNFERFGAVEERFVGSVLPDGRARYRRAPDYDNGA